MASGRRNSIGHSVIAVLAIIASANPVAAQGLARANAFDYPAKPVRMIVPLAPGGGSDIVGRILALELTNQWGQSVVVDNRPGAGSTVGTALVAKAPADGYTVLVSSSSIAISPALYKNLDFDVRRDFAGVTLIASQPSILAVHSSVPANTLKELIALAKAHPGKLAYASAGTGSATHLGTELLKVWHADAGRHAEAYHRAPSKRRRPHHQVSAGPRTIVRAGSRRLRNYSSRIRGLSQCRNREMGKGGARCRRARRMTRAGRLCAALTSLSLALLPAAACAEYRIAAAFLTSQ